MRGSGRPSTTGGSQARNVWLTTNGVVAKSMCGFRLRRMQRRHDLPVPHLQQHLGQPRDARRRFAMADVRFGRSDQAEPGVLRVPSKGLGQRRDLDRVAQLGARAVRFDVADRAARRVRASASAWRIALACACGFGTV